MNQVRSLQAAKTIAELNDNLRKHVSELELKFQNDSIEDENTLFILDDIAECTNDILDELEHINSQRNLNNISEVIARMYSVAKGAKINFQPNTMDQYVYDLRMKLKPKLKLYRKYGSILDNLDS